MVVNASVHNCFDIVVRDTETDEIKKEVRAENILLDQFWTGFFNESNTVTNYIHFGRGTTEPLVTDTELTNFIASKPASTVSFDTSTFKEDGVVKIKKTIRIEVGERVGETLSEVGFATLGTQNTLRTKALIKDANGNPLSILIGPLDLIDIFATFFVKFPMSVINGTDGIKLNEKGSAIERLSGFVAIKNMNNPKISSGVSFPFTISTSNGDAYSNYDHQLTRSSVVADLQNRTITLNYNNLSAAGANYLKGFSSISPDVGLCIKLPRPGFGQSVIEKEVVGVGDGVTKDFICKFGKITDDGTAKLYVDDIEVPASFDYGVPRWNKFIETYLNVLSENESEIIFENPFNTHYGLNYTRMYSSELYCSDDGINWEFIKTSPASGAYFYVPETLRYRRFWKIKKNKERESYMEYMYTEPTIENNAPIIHADTAPPVGSTISLSYRPNCIAKDELHVVQNMQIKFSFNEYTP